MAKTETRGNEKAKAPISRHPLFPAMVALWCAALLGLGSLAIGTIALENLVRALRIDLLLPIAAPPLGIKARILLALVLFAVGAVSGYMVARRIARPRDAVPPRSFRQNERADASDDLGEDFARLDAAAASQTAAPIPGRRRALAMEEDYALEFHEHMPLPGGAPQILDLAELGAFSEMPERYGDDERDDEQSGFVTPTAEEPAETNQIYDPWNRHSAGTGAQAQQSTIALVPAAPIVDEARPFAAPSANPISAFAQPAEPFAPDFRQPGFVPPVAMEDAPPQPVFAQDFAPEPASMPPSMPAPEPASFSSPFPAPEAATSQSDTSDTAEPELVDAASALRAFTAPAVPAFTPEPDVNAAPVAAALYAEPPAAVLGLVPSDAAEKLMKAPIDSLGVVELAERLALAISRRRGAAETSQFADSAPVVEAAPAAPAANMAEPVRHFAVPSAIAAPAEQDAPPRFAVPHAFAPPSPGAPANPISEMAVQPSAQPSIMPSSMRPLQFDEQDDDDSLDSVLPPRLFGKTAQPVPAAFQGFPAQPTVVEPEPAQTEAAGGPGSPDGPDSDGTGEESFGSLLGMKPTVRETFVRIEEPVDDQAPVEPVVVFPGQAGHTSLNNDSALRRFDQPGAIAPGQAFAGPNTVNPEETERALKAALATLQRMSGAA